MKSPIRVAVTGAAGNIGYALLFRLGSGSCFGEDQPIALSLLEIPPAMKALDGVVMELLDAAFPLVHSIDTYDDPKKAFEGVQQALLVGSRPRGPGMERADLIRANGPIFVDQGQALNAGAASDVRVLVVGNPCNTNALITMHSAPDIPRTRFTAMTRLDENRAKSQIAKKLGMTAGQITRMSVWGNHSNTMFPDFYHALANGQPLTDQIDEAWLQGEFMQTVSTRGKAIILARGASSAASAANAALDHMATWHSGTSDGEWTSMAVASNGQYGIPEGLICSVPVTVKNGVWSVVENINHNGFAQTKIAATVAELESERSAVKELLT